MDTAEIRIHTYNRFISKDEKALSWETKVNEIDRNLKEVLLLQPNREPDNVFYGGWNDYLSQTVLNWVMTKDDDFFEFKFPSKGSLLAQVTSFIIHHPVRASRVSLPKPAAKKQPFIIPQPTQRVDVVPAAKQQLHRTTTANAVVNAVADANGPSTRPIIRPDALPASPAVHPDRKAMMQQTPTPDPMQLDNTKKRQLSHIVSPVLKQRKIVSNKGGGRRFYTHQVGTY